MLNQIAKVVKMIFRRTQSGVIIRELYTFYITVSSWIFKSLKEKDSSVYRKKIHNISYIFYSFLDKEYKLYKYTFIIYTYSTPNDKPRFIEHLSYNSQVFYSYLFIWDILVWSVSSTAWTFWSFFIFFFYFLQA